MKDYEKLWLFLYKKRVCGYVANCGKTCADITKMKKWKYQKVYRNLQRLGELGLADCFDIWSDGSYMLWLIFPPKMKGVKLTTELEKKVIVELL